MGCGVSSRDQFEKSGQGGLTVGAAGCSSSVSGLLVEEYFLYQDPVFAGQGKREVMTKRYHSLRAACMARGLRFDWIDLRDLH